MSRLLTAALAAVLLASLGGFGVLVGIGLSQGWTAAHWGPLSAWVASGLTVIAVTVALVSAHRSQLATEAAEVDRAIGHEVDRRLTAIGAIADVWRDLNSLGPRVASLVDFIEDRVPEEFPIGTDAMDTFLTVFPELSERTNDFFEATAPYAISSFRAEALVSGELRVAFDELDQAFRNLHGHVRGLLIILARQKERPDTRELERLWQKVKELREPQIAILREHYSVDRASIRRQLNV